MNLTLWIVAGLLAVVFLLGGVSKLTVPKQKLATVPGGSWVEDFSPGAVKALGVIDLLAAAGLILPAALGIAPILVPLAAVAVVLLMVGASMTHRRHHQTAAVMLNVAYLVLASFVAWGRFGPESF